MTNQDLVRQYVDTGIGIPEYQFNKLSSNLKNTYIRKRLIAFENRQDSVVPYSYEISFIPEEKSKRYKDMALGFYNEGKGIISPFLFSFLDDEQQGDVMGSQYREQGVPLWEESFKMLSPKNKRAYLKMLVWSHRPLHDFEFEWLDEEGKSDYISRYIWDTAINLTDMQLMAATPEQRRKYLESRSKSGYSNFSAMQRGMLTPEQKESHAIDKVRRRLIMTDEEFGSLPEDKKASAAFHLADGRIWLTPLQFGYLDDGTKRWYVMQRAGHGFDLPGKEYTDQLDPKTRAEYEKAVSKHLEP